MKTQQALFVYLGILFLILNSGCNKPPLDAVSKSLNSTNAVFQPTGQGDVFELSPQQISTIKRVVERLNDRSRAKVEKEDANLIAPSGAFVLGDVHFLWFGSYLYIHDPKTERYDVVEDAILGQMDSDFKKAEGSTVPLNEPTKEQWRKKLSVLE